MIFDIETLSAGELASMTADQLGTLRADETASTLAADQLDADWLKPGMTDEGKLKAGLLSTEEKIVTANPPDLKAGLVSEGRLKRGATNGTGQPRSGLLL
jgi:hypothetical protein